MKIYHLIIAYNDKTEEVEYIQEEIEDSTSMDLGLHNPATITIDLGEGNQFEAEVLVKLIDEFGLGEA